MKIVCPAWAARRVGCGRWRGLACPARSTPFWPAGVSAALLSPALAQPGSRWTEHLPVKVVHSALGPASLMAYTAAACATLQTDGQSRAHRTPARQAGLQTGYPASLHPTCHLLSGHTSWPRVRGLPPLRGAGLGMPASLRSPSSESQTSHPRPHTSRPHPSSHSRSRGPSERMLMF